MSNMFSNNPANEDREGMPQTSVPDLQGLNPPTGAERKKRTRTGCVNCSRRRRKCDEAKPTCTGCKRRGDKCQWRMMGAFRDSNIKVLESDHPSMSQGVAASRNKRHSKFKIVNTASTRTKRAPKQQGQPLPAPEQGPGHGSPPPSAPDESDTPVPAAIERNDSDSAAPLAANEISASNPGVNPGISPPYSSDTSSHPRKTFNEPPGHIELQTHVSPLGPQVLSPHSHYDPTLQFDFQPSHSRDDSISHPYINSSPEYVINDLSALRGLHQDTQFHSSVADSYQTGQSPVFDHGIFSDPTDLINDVFLPGSAYEALHTTLRNRQLWTARPDFPSRRSSQDSVPMVHTPTGYSDAGSVARTARGSRHSGISRRFELSPEREHVLWENYLHEICSWLDMFDNQRHFASTFTQMAKTSAHLRYSILALSARQLERQQNAKSQSESLSLYQEAIHLLLPELGSKTTPVIASCVILCVLEMLSCNPKEWRRHLDGCAYLIQAAGINGFSGKEEQALFWCFARMDVCGGLISEEETIIPIHNWRPSDMTYNEAAQIFIASAKTNVETYANYTVYLVARVVNILFGCASKPDYSCTSCQSVPSDDGDSFVPRWADAFDRVEEWYEKRPAQMKSIFSVAASEREGRDRAFPIALYGNGSAISGNQMYHVAALLLLQRKPKTLALNKRPPLWIAGKAMSHYSEHAAIVETLVRIERETGWATAWRVEDLKEFWGEYDNDEDYDVDMN
ncbi:uncharacterized protein N7511_010397 [Penicillium nucicola]|uniref:uncharacterized protein n=1 Tax=Penicillium nucicola TaxID=1850975 RepID=UPI0025453B24|nr:uncharacterized protein N7511_010397 [Penicillium nucicola]KAJ5748701.1 hypothetical protein N7511_010397 [Penicillium nucicola]